MPDLAARRGVLGYWRRHRSVCIAALLLTAFVIRLGAGVWWQQRLGESRFGFGDSDSYWHLAGDIARGDDYAYGTRSQVFRTPGYPLLLSLLFWRGKEPPVLAARVLNALLGTLAVAAAMMTANAFRVAIDRDLMRFKGERGEALVLTTGVLATFYPGAIAMSVFVLSEAPFTPCLMLQLCAALRAMRSSTRRWPLVVGALGGLATLVRPSWLLFTPGLAALDLLRRRLAADSWRRSLWMACGLCLVMLPWWVRNYQVTGHVVVTTLQLGASLMDGLGPQADGSSDMKFAESAYLELKREYQQRGQGISGFEYELNQRLRDRSVAWVKQHPRRALELAFIKLTRMWNIWPNSQDFSSLRLRLLLAAGYLPLLTLSVVGLWRLRRVAEAWVLCLPVCYLTALHVIFVSSIRYRQPGLVALTPVASAALLLSLASFTRRERS